MNRRAVLAVAMATLLETTAAIAQVTGSDNQEELEELIVTGSRLIRPGAVSPIPVTSIDAEEIDISGATSIGEYVSELPSMGIGVSRTTNVGGDAPDTLGTNLLDLRDLGSSRTLVLVDGRRHIGSVAGSTSVDVSSIPTAIIERVEVSTGGASVSYGADAVAGVVNFITKSDFEGIQVDARYGVTDEGGGDSKYISITAGGNFASDRGNAVVNATYNSEGGIAATDRDWLRRQAAYVVNPDDTGPDDGIPALILADNVRLPFTSQTGNLVGLITGETLIFNNDGSVRAFDPGVNTGGTFSIGGDGYNVVNVQQIANPIDRTSLMGRVSYALTDNANIFVEGKHYGVDATNVSQSSFDFFTHFEDGDLFLVDPENPFLPVGDALFDQFVADNAGLMMLSRWHDDFGLRTGIVDRNTYRIVTGIEGSVPRNDWAYEMFVQYGESSEQRNSLNGRDPRRFRLAADAVVDVTGVTGVPPGSPACRATVDAALSGIPVFDADITECKPVNVFGFGLASQEAIDYFETELLTIRELQQLVVGGSIAGDVLELPGGVASFVAGFEYRSEESSSQPDSRLVKGETFLGETLPVHGTYDVVEGFLETRIPVLQDVRFAESLAIEGGIRGSEYDSIGSTFSWRAGGDWTPVEGLRFRGMYAEAVRAPNISELFQAQGEGFASVNDPCDKDQVNLGPNPARRLANCTADLAGLNLDPLTFDDPTAGVAKPAIIGGNPNLNEETAESITLGLVYSPAFIENATLTVDYYDIEIRDAIATPNTVDLVNDCYDRFDSIDNDFCRLFTRSTTPGRLGAVEGVVATILNLDAIRTSGIDFEIDYNLEMARMMSGTFHLRMLGTYLDEYEVLPANDAANANENAGELAFPQWRVNTQLMYERDRFLMSYLLRYYSSAAFDVQEENPEEARDPFGVSAHTISDIQLRYRIGSRVGQEGFDVYFGVNNLFDKEPPPGVREGNAPTATPLYDPIGRFFYGGVTARF